MKNALKRTLSVMLVFMMVISCFTGMSVFAENEDKPSASIPVFVSDSKVSEGDVSGSDISDSDVSGSDVSDTDVSGSDVSGSDVSVITSVAVDSGNEDKGVVICLGGSFEAVAKGKNIYNKIALFNGTTILGKPVLVGSEKEKLSSVEIKYGTFVLPANNDAEKAVEYVIRAYDAKVSDSDITATAGEKVGVVTVAKKTDTVEVKPEVVSFSDKGGTADLAVRTNANVSVSLENGSWITLAQEAGNGVTIIKLTAKENKGLAREAAVVFKTTGAVPHIVRVSVVQEGINNVDRLAGDTRIETAVAISKEGWEKADTVILACADKFADALAAAPLSAAVDAPVLLTFNKTEGLEKAVVDEIARLGAKKVYILGGTSAIRAEIENALATSGSAVTRLAGDTRYGTAVAVAKELSKITGKPFTTIYFASGVNFPDALSISSIAAIEGNPILYMPAKGEVDKVTGDYVTESKCKTGVVLGGDAAVSAEGLSSLSKLGLSVTRISGADRFATSQAINKKYEALFTGKNIAVATGVDFPDALAGGALCAKEKMPVVLVSDKSADSALTYIKGEAPDGLVIFGGPKAVSDAVAVKLAAGIKQAAAETDNK